MSPRNHTRPLLAILVLAGCVVRSAPEPPPAAASEASVAHAGSETAPCPRVERAARTWSGFLVDVPNEAMVEALEVVTPIQRALGETFCAQARVDCRPTKLQAIDLTDASAREAHVRVTLERGGELRELSLILQASDETSAQGEVEKTWSAEPTSLASYLALCRASTQTSTQTTKAAPE